MVTTKQRRHWAKHKQWQESHRGISSRDMAGEWLRSKDGRRAATEHAQRVNKAKRERRKP